MMSLEQAYNCAVVLGCTIDEIAGLRHDSISGLTERESELVSLYRNCTSDRQRRTLDDLRDRAAMSGEVEDLAPQALPTRERLSA